MQSDYDIDSEGFSTWDEFYGAGNDDLVGSLLEIYERLMGRSIEPKKNLLSSQKVEREIFDKHRSRVIENVNNEECGENPRIRESFRSQRKTSMEPNSNCLCAGKTIPSPVTSCSSCRGDRIRYPQFAKETEISVAFDADRRRQRFRLDKYTDRNLPPTPFPTFDSRPEPEKVEFSSFSRPCSVTSIESSASSTSSGASSYTSGRRLPLTAQSKSPHNESEEEEEEKTEWINARKNRFSKFSEESECSGDSGIHNLSSCQQNQSKSSHLIASYMDKVVKEIIETEKVYVRDLREIIEGYLLKWRSIPNFFLTDQLNCLFGNIESVFLFNSWFLKELEECDLDAVKVARCFVNNTSGFSVYTEYCTNYPRTVSLLTDLMRQEDVGRLFRERQSALRHTLPLGSYLLKPVQRILKYHLLLQNMVREYSNGSEGYKDIVEALRTMTEIARHINDMKRRHEHKVRVQEIQSLLLGWEKEDLTTFGELCAEGTFKMHGAKAVRHVFLFDKMVLITKKKEGGILDYKTHINCSNLMLVESIPGEPLGFHVIPFDNPKLQCTLQARNYEQKREWTLLLKRVILENYNAVIPSHAKRLVMELGRSKTEEEENSSNLKNLSKKQHVALEYLEKRKQIRKKIVESHTNCRLPKKFNMDYGLKSETRPTTNDGVNQKELVTKMQSLKMSKNNQATSRNETFSHSSEIGSKIKDGGAKMEAKSTVREADERPMPNQNIFSEPDSTSRLRQSNSNMRIRSREIAQSLSNLESYETEMTHERFRESFKRATPAGEKQNGDSIEKTRVRSFGSESEFASRNDFLDTSIDYKRISSPSFRSKKQVQRFGSLTGNFSKNSAASIYGSGPCSRDCETSIESSLTPGSNVFPGSVFRNGEFYAKDRYRDSASDVSEDENFIENVLGPEMSMNHINVHPEYKIYRLSLTRYNLKNALLMLHGKFSRLKTDSIPKMEVVKTWAGERNEKRQRGASILTEQYQRTLRNGLKKLLNSKKLLEHIFKTSPDSNFPMHKQGSSGLGARLANFTESDFRSFFPNEREAANLPDESMEIAILSRESNCGSPSLTKCESAIISKKSATFKCPESKDDETLDNIYDSFYEKIFETLDEETMTVDDRKIR